MSLFEDAFGDSNKNSPKQEAVVDKENSTKEEVKEEKVIFNTNDGQFTDLRHLEDDLVIGSANVNPIALLTGKEGKRLNEIPTEFTFNGVLISLNTSHIDLEHNVEPSSYAYFVLSEIYHTKLDEYNVGYAGNNIDFTSEFGRQQSPVGYNRLLWFKTFMQAFYHGAGLNINLMEKATIDSNGQKMYRNGVNKSLTKSPFSFLLNQYLGKVESANLPHSDYRKRAEHLINMISTLADTCSELTYSAAVFKTVENHYEELQDKQRFVISCKERGLDKKLGEADTFLRGLFDKVNTQIYSQWVEGFYSHLLHTGTSDASVKLEQLLHHNMSMVLPMLTVLIANLDKEDVNGNNLQGLSLMYTRLEMQVAAAVADIDVSSVKATDVSMMHSTITNYWGANSQYTAILSRTFNTYNIIPKISTKYGVLNPLSITFEDHTKEMSKEELAEFYYNRDNEIMYGGIDRTDPAYALKEEFTQEETIMTDREKLTAYAASLGYTHVLPNLANMLGTDFIYAKDKTDDGLECFTGHLKFVIAPDNATITNLDGERIALFDDGELRSNPLNPEGWEWISQISQRFTKYITLPTDVKALVFEDASKTTFFYPEEYTGLQTLANDGWGNLVKNLHVTSPEGWAFNVLANRVVFTNLDDYAKVEYKDKMYNKRFLDTLAPKTFLENYTTVKDGTTNEHSSLLSSLAMFANGTTDYNCTLYTHPWMGASYIERLLETMPTNHLNTVLNDLLNTDAIKTVLIAGRTYLAFNAASESTDKVLSAMFVNYRESVNGSCDVTYLTKCSDENIWYVPVVEYADDFATGKVKVLQLYVEDRVMELPTQPETKTSLLEETAKANSRKEDLPLEKITPEVIEDVIENEAAVKVLSSPIKGNVVKETKRVTLKELIEEFAAEDKALEEKLAEDMANDYERQYLVTTQKKEIRVFKLTTDDEVDYLEAVREVVKEELTEEVTPETFKRVMDVVVAEDNVNEGVDLTVPKKVISDVLFPAINSLASKYGLDLETDYALTDVGIPDTISRYLAKKGNAETDLVNLGKATLLALKNVVGKVNTSSPEFEDLILEHFPNFILGQNRSKDIEGETRYIPNWLMLEHSNPFTLHTNISMESSIGYIEFNDILDDDELGLETIYEEEPVYLLTKENVKYQLHGESPELYFGKI